MTMKPYNLCQHRHYWALLRLSLQHNAECIRPFLDRLQPFPTFARFYYDSKSIPVLNNRAWLR